MPLVAYHGHDKEAFFLLRMTIMTRTSAGEKTEPWRREYKPGSMAELKQRVTKGQRARTAVKCQFLLQ